MGTIQSYLRERAELTPEVEAVVGGAERFTYRQFYERVNQLVHYLLELGVEKGDRIGILCKNHHPFPTILFAAIRVGAVVIPLNWRLTAYELSNIMESAEPKVLFYDEEYADALQFVKEKATVPHVLPVGEGLSLVESFAAVFTKYPVTEPRDVLLADDDLAFMLFTSGTTGLPKGCMISHKGVDAYFSVESIRQTFPPGMKFLAVHPLFHMSSTMMMVSNVKNGVTMVFLADDRPIAILDTIEREKINVMFAFPAIYRFMLEELKHGHWDLSSLRFLSSGGTHVPASLIKEYCQLGLVMGQGYGSTEAWAISGWNPTMGLNKADSVGKLAPGVELKIADPETGAPLPPGEIGEVVVRSPYLFQGYWRNPEATAKVLRDGWFHTGDAGYVDEEGFLYISSRYKDVIVYGGDNVYPGEIEEVIHQLPDVLEVAVIGIPHEVMGEAPCACIIKKTGSTLAAEQVIHLCRERLAAYKVPEVMFVDQLPKNGLGKVMKHRLKEQVLRRS
ncbi:long-chain acyl-CoA synthetase [Laceyella sediminis]|uniref:Long-chain acyl-CoA synthetase n=1 Tax=Laceyella sediminis TaxID=573074 RepID=A0ABX5ES04_9BACL|nr:class I adenylate-forming enzyme family protein [Laceyella sediminis]PRZ14758.1 long-chain acyl-CoA synthetase [Laceyella sediminis]